MEEINNNIEFKILNYSNNKLNKLPILPFNLKILYCNIKIMIYYQKLKLIMKRLKIFDIKN
jgi:hypothetical protein